MGKGGMVERVRQVPAFHHVLYNFDKVKGNERHSDGSLLSNDCAVRLPYNRIEISPRQKWGRETGTGLDEEVCVGVKTNASDVKWIDGNLWCDSTFYYEVCSRHVFSFVFFLIAEFVAFLLLLFQNSFHSLTAGRWQQSSHMRHAKHLQHKQHITFVFSCIRRRLFVSCRCPSIHPIHARYTHILRFDFIY